MPAPPTLTDATPDHRRRPSRAVDVVLVVTGRLVLVTPASVGGAAPEGATDVPLLEDPVSGRVLYRGSSLKGSVRHALLEREFGRRLRDPGQIPDKDLHASWASRLCGGDRGDTKGLPSPLIIEDALADEKGREYRSSTRVDNETGAAHDGSLRQRALLRAGSSFDLEWTLEVGPDTVLSSTDDPERALRRALAATLEMIHDGSVRLGARTTRGFGEVILDDLCVRRFDLRTPAGLAGWLTWKHDWRQDDDPSALGVPKPDGKSGSFQEVERWLLYEEPDKLRLPDCRACASLDATFHVRTSLMVGEPEPLGSSADTRHLRAGHGLDGAEAPILPGTSAAGALRARARRIGPRAEPDLFGFAELQCRHDGDQTRRSRIRIRERPVVGGEQEHVVTRVALDDATMGTVKGKLFAQQPILSYPPGTATDPARTAAVRLCIDVRHATAADVGLLLLLLKDLWTRDLPLGGGFGVGRGRLEGHEARLSVRSLEGVEGHEESKTWTIRARAAGRLEVERPDELEAFVTAFQERARDSENSDDGEPTSTPDADA